MPVNVEVKARVANLDLVLEAALRLGARDEGIEDQTDRYYAVDASGAERVKLRTGSRRTPHVVRYRRPEGNAVRTSEYEITPVRDEAAAACLVPVGQPLVTVHKRRHLLMIDNVRIHLDEVQGLGSFVELEAVVDDRHDETVCRLQALHLSEALGLQLDEMICASYSDLMTEQIDEKSGGSKKVSKSKHKAATKPAAKKGSRAKSGKG